MVESDRHRFMTAFGTLCEIFGKEPTQIFIEGYFRALSGFEIADVERAIGRAIGECKFFPKPVELKDFVTGGAGGLEDKALFEATRVLKAIKSIGDLETVCFDDPTTQAVIVNGFGGWMGIEDKIGASQGQWFIKDFSKIYQAYHRQGIKHYGTLMGLLESQYHGLSSQFRGEMGPPSPVLIGDQDKATEIATKSGGDILGGPTRIELIETKALKLVGTGASHGE